MQAAPGAACGQFGSAYDTPIIQRFSRLISFPSSLDVNQLSPRLREMCSARPPIMIVDGLCGERRIGLFQLNWRGVASGLMMFARPPPRPPCAGAGALSPPAAKWAPAPPPPPPPPRPPPTLEFGL